ncbi:MAG TPA: hypothetical protein VGR19_12000 [Allosphingosinicella sp.]|nr:hypothetical protein [Allosphingosinicella sp.]
MQAISTDPTTTQKARGVTVRYEVHREREPGRKGAERQPLVEEFYGLDRARIAALGFALDGPTMTGDRFTGLVRVYQAMHLDDSRTRRSLVDVIDERLASRLLNETRLPRADQLALSLERLQGSVDALLPG